MKVSAVNSNTQSFGAISKLVYTTGGVQKTCLFSKTNSPNLPKKVGEFLLKQNGDVAGKRTFANGASISFDTSHGSLFKEPYVPYELKFPDGKKGFSRRLFVFDLQKFKENFEQLTTLKGIKKYLADIEKAPKKTKFEPCC